jgi:hypothetical protein
MIRKTVFLLAIVFVVLSGCISDTNAGKGTVQFTSSPAGAQVYLDSQFRGSTPTSVAAVGPGNHTIEFRYPGYESWSSVMVVAPGQNNVFAALLPSSGSISPAGGIVPAGTTSSPVSVTIQENREMMVIGDSIVFSGSAGGTSQVLLTLYGPGFYAKGVSMPQANVNSLGLWAYTWNPGTSIQAGTYSMVVSDPYKTVSERVDFTVTGGGLVSITANSLSAAKGDTLQFSGLCTTGSRNVDLVLYGPDRFAGGIDMGTFPVMADKNWNFKYTLDNTMTTGVYTMYVYDVPKTSSSTVQFTVGYVGG